MLVTVAVQLVSRATVMGNGHEQGPSLSLSLALWPVEEPWEPRPWRAWRRPKAWAWDERRRMTRPRRVWGFVAAIVMDESPRETVLQKANRRRMLINLALE